VLCEKPLGRNQREAIACAEEARGAARLLHVGANHLTFPSVRLVRRLVQGGLVGTPRAIAIAVGHGRLGELPAWMLDRACSGGGTLRDNGTHAFVVLDALLACDGDAVESLRCLTERPSGIPTDVEVFACCTMHTRLGKAVVSTASWMDTVPYRFDLVVQGDCGTLVARGPDRLLLRLNGRLHRVRWTTSPRSSWQCDTRAFVDALAGAPHTKCGLASAVRSAGMIDAAYESAWRGRTIRLAPPAVPSPERDALHATVGLPLEPG
jgi:predicted dehydrogenase